MWVLRATFYAAVLTWAVAGAAEAGKPVDAPGLASYRLYCAECHGTDAKGVGAFAEEDTGNLTRLGLKYGWPLPKRRLLDALGSRRPSVATWSRDASPCAAKLVRGAPGSSTGGVFRRGTALEILYFLDAAQEPPRVTADNGPHPAASSPR